MKTTLINIALASGCLAMLTACDENSWNDHLDGFDGNVTANDTRTIEYTLTDADYASLASLTANKTLAGDSLSSALAAVGSKHRFDAQISAADFVPAFLSSSSFPYFTLDNGSAVKLTYNVAQALPAAIAKSQQAEQFLIDEPLYKQVWESDDNYISAFAPSHPASKFIPGILKEQLDEALSGDYAIVTYAQADQEPVFGDQKGEEPQKFELSSTIGSATSGADIQVNGLITGVCATGYILTDASGSIFVYVKSGFDATTHSVGTQITISGPVGNYNAGLQIVGADAEETIVGTEKYTYPTAPVITGEQLDQIATDYAAAKTDGPFKLARYGSITGTVKVSGNNINITDIAGATNAQGGVYYATDDQKAALVDGTQVTVTGYLIAVAGGRYCNFVATAITPASKSSRVKPYRAPAAPVATTVRYAVYQFNGTSWAAATNFVILQPSDYTAMGQNYGNLSNSAKPQDYLPTFLRTSFPYATAGTEKFVLYKYYDGTNTNYLCDQYKYDGAQWKLNDGIVQETAQFVKAGGKWNFDPSVTITLPSGKGQALSTQYYQACVDWVYENIDKPLGSTSIKSGQYYISSYGNNEYYSGTSAYQGNVDLRADKAREQYPAGYEGMDNDQIIALMKDRFEHQVMPGALAMLHPDAVPVPGVEVIYTINFAVYTGTTSTYTIRYKVVGKGQFEFIDCNW